jgi:tetratricopeptide (TPR) repeat protein
LQNIGAILVRTRRYREARATLEQALPRLLRYYGAKDPHIGAVYGNLADVYRNLGDSARGVDFARRAIDVDTAVSGAEHPDVGSDWLKLARCSEKLGEPTQALLQIDRALEIFGKTLPPAHPTRIQAANYKAEFLIDLGKTEQARQLLESFSDVQTTSVDTRRSLLAGLVILAEIERRDSQWQKSRALAEQVLGDRAVPGDRVLEASARWALASALAIQGETVAAEQERTRALELETSIGEETPFAGVVAFARSYACAGDSARALAILREAAAKGFHDPSIMRDPAFAALREQPGFAAVAVNPGARLHPAVPDAH